MPKLRKRGRQPIDRGSTMDASPTSPTSDKTSQTRHKPRYHHYAANIRYSRSSQTQDNLSEASTTLSTNVILGILVVSLLICFGRTPDMTLRMLLLGQTVFCDFPPFFPNWIVLLAALLPMKIQNRTGVVLGSAILSWISSLEWGYAWDRIIHKITRGQNSNRDEEELEV